MTSTPANPPPAMTTRKLVIYSLIVITTSIASAFAFRYLTPKSSLSSVAFPGILLVALVAPFAFFMRRTFGKKPSKPDRIAAGVLSSIGVVSFMAAFLIASPPFLNHLLSDPSGMLMPLTMFLAFPGLQLLIFALRHRRVGDSLHCPKCDYELGVSPDDAPIRCPECGTAWLGRWQKGASRRSPALALLGALLILSGSLPWLFKLTALGNVSLGLLSTPTLISVTALDPWGHNKDAWAELTARKLTPQDNDRLAEKLLNLRLSAGYLYGSPASWLDTAVTTHAISQPLIDRYYADWFQATIALPDTLPTGQPVPISVTADDRKGGPATWMYIWIESVTVDGLPVPSPTFEPLNQKWFFSLDFTEPAFSSSAWSSSHNIVFADFDTSQPGPHNIKITAYRCVVPRGTIPTTLTFQNSKPIPPPTAIHFSEFTIEKAVTVSSP